jgi:hypothetical protein
MYAPNIDSMTMLTRFCRCTLTSQNGEKLGWRARHGSDHILKAAAEEVESILDHLEKDGN